MSWAHCGAHPQTVVCLLSGEKKMIKEQPLLITCTLLIPGKVQINY
jgi:hypothetical protein